MQWLGLLLPFALALIYKVQFRRDILWWEYFSTLAIAVAVVWGCGAAYSFGVSSDTKLRSGYVCGKEYIPGHWITVCSSCGKSTCCHPVYIPPVWDLRFGTTSPRVINQGFNLVGESGEKTLIVSEEKYDRTSIGEIAAWEERFENPLRRSKSNLYKAVTEKKYPSLEAPEIYNYYDINRITNLSGLPIPDRHKELNGLNSALNKYNINLGFVICKYPEEFAQYQENYWRGGNPNDLIVFLGVDDTGKLQWVKSIKWGNDLLALEIRDTLLAKKLTVKDLDQIISIVVSQIRSRSFVEADFSKFNYIQVEFPVWMLIVIYVLTLVATVIDLEYFRQNEYYEGNNTY